MLGRLSRSALLLHQLQHKTPNHFSQSPKIDLVTRQGGGALFSSDVFIEDRVAAGVVAGEDVLLATAVDLMMARDCEGALGCSAVFVGAYASSCFCIEWCVSRVISCRLSIRRNIFQSLLQAGVRPPSSWLMLPILCVKCAQVCAYERQARWRVTAVRQR